MTSTDDNQGDEPRKMEELHGEDEVDPVKKMGRVHRKEKKPILDEVKIIDKDRKIINKDKNVEDTRIAPKEDSPEKNTSDEEQKSEQALKAEEEKRALNNLTTEKQKNIAQRLQTQLDFNKEHPLGVTLLARDNKNNRRLFPEGPFGTIDVAETDCADNGTTCPHYSSSIDIERDQAKETPIHILIAAFRDKLCARTLHNAFSHASNPSRLFLRVIDQTKKDSALEDDAGCWELYCDKYNTNCQEYQSQVRIVKIDASLSRGPTYARSKLSAMVHWDYTRREDPVEIDLKSVQLNDFCMQIDSHMDFSDNFDTGLIEMHHRTKNDYAVLSTYVTDIESNNQNELNVPNLCMVTFTSSIRNWGTKECKYLAKPKLTNAMWGAGLSFHRCHAELVVPVDPYLDNVFDGEEGSRGIRFFTHGYDVYTPDVVLVTHDYKTHQGNPVVHTWGRGAKQQMEEDEEGDGMKLPGDRWKWNEEIEEQRSELNVFGTDRVNMLLGIGSHHNSTEQEKRELDLIRNSRFGLGTARTMEQAREFTGINLLEKRMEVNKCGNNYWVPYGESPDFGVAAILARGNIGKVETKLVVLAAEKKPEEENLDDLKKARGKKKSKKASGTMKMPLDMGQKEFDNGSPKDPTSEHVETPKPLFSNAPPQIRRAAAAFKAKEEVFLKNAVAFKDKEEAMLANGEVDFKVVGGGSLVILMLIILIYSQTTRQRAHKKKS
jgi:hypothetical protein